MQRGLEAQGLPFLRVKTSVGVVDSPSDAPFNKLSMQEMISKIYRRVFPVNLGHLLVFTTCLRSMFLSNDGQTNLFGIIFLSTCVRSLPMLLLFSLPKWQRCRGGNRRDKDKINFRIKNCSGVVSSDCLISRTRWCLKALHTLILLLRQLKWPVAPGHPASGASCNGVYHYVLI